MSGMSYSKVHYPYIFRYLGGTILSFAVSFVINILQHDGIRIFLSDWAITLKNVLSLSAPPIPK